MVVVSVYCIFVIDDQVINCMVVQILLIYMGYEVIIVDGGERGLDGVCCECFDLIFMDIYMFDFDGLEIIKVLLVEGGVLIGMFIIVFMVSMMDEDCQKYVQVGMSDCIGKLLELDVFQIVIVVYVMIVLYYWVVQ